MAIESCEYEVEWWFKDQYETRTFDTEEEANEKVEGLKIDPCLDIRITKHVTFSSRHYWRPSKNNR